jgi:hypothetical protein
MSDSNGIGPSILGENIWIVNESQQRCVVGERIIIVIAARNILDFDVETSQLRLLCALELADGTLGMFF